MTDALSSPAVSAVSAYHEASKHRAEGFAPGPGPVDWDAQPTPVRRYDGAYRLPLAAGRVPPGPIGAMTLGRMLALALGVNGWKSHGGPAWPLRAVPSSGGLYPVETWVLSGAVPGMTDGVWHYDPEAHGISLRADPPISPGLWVGFSRVMWRETWKYGLRAFRYTQLDLGHAIASVALAAASMGWQARLLPAQGLDQTFGLDRADLEGFSPERAEALLAIGPNPSPKMPEIGVPQWHGTPRVEAGAKVQDWPGLDEIDIATEGVPDTTTEPATGGLRFPPAAFLNRRSARRFTAKALMPMETLVRMLRALDPARAPFDLFSASAPVHLGVYVHKVEGLAPGLYIWPRGPQHELPEAARPVPEAPGLFRLREGDLRAEARRLSCGQGIAGEGAVCLVLFADLSEAAGCKPWQYRALHWQAGAIGQALYLAASAEGLGASGIGCFLDDPSAQSLGLQASQAVLYHFALGYAVPDPHLRSGPDDAEDG